MKVSICHAEKGSCNLNVQIQNHDRTFVLGLGSASPPPFTSATLLLRIEEIEGINN